MVRPETYRVLVTGSQGWRDEPRLTFEIGSAVREGSALDCDVVIVHGACAVGADRLADDFAAVHGIPVERHYARWRAPCTARCSHGPRRNNRCPAAAQYRNEHLVSLGADVCLAFIARCTRPSCMGRPRHGSHGASRTADLAEKAGIPTRRFTDGG